MMNTGSDIPYEDIIAEIKKSVSDLSVEERREIFNMFSNIVDDSYIHEKNTGVQINFKNIPPHIVVSIHKYIQNKITAKKAAIQYFPSD